MISVLRKFIPGFLISYYHLLLAFLSAVFYRFPSQKLIIIGVTGTAGKSTVVEMLHQIFREAGLPIASLSSIGFKIQDKEEINLFKMTMPGRGYIQKFLRKAKNAGCKYVVIEVTSEGILQNRHCFIDFNTAVFTNLSPEHIERHGTFEKYKEAKGNLFQIAKKIHIVNLDDKNTDYFLKFQADKKYGYSISPKSIIKNLTTGESFEVEFNLKLLGEFNVYNSLAAVCVALSQGIDLEVCKKALEKIKAISGRMEVIIKEPFSVIVDYAHTPDELEKVYKTIQDTKLICVLGAAGGGRDKWKRPEFGKIANQYCDEIILTNEDPYDENPNQILSEIEQGIKKSFQKILDRRKAIKKALSLARPGDTIIITGKGCEPWMCVAGGKKIPWDDRQIVKEEMQELKNKV
ncbi:UDP-N-acetylmuramoyl-L-alanyl-D-glutamate--2,6-diaminopimelate ligase [Candidatus Parcubacteria bacterium]|nr:UDP-N-acetylmuramoyl-L-alanyl-D-glutamate--2,6-diaminopimelate ligase [Candidatus Parcubacteria bacterium]